MNKNPYDGFLNLYVVEVARKHARDTGDNVWIQGDQVMTTPGYHSAELAIVGNVFVNCTFAGLETDEHATNN